MNRRDGSLLSELLILAVPARSLIYQSPPPAPEWFVADSLRSRNRHKHFTAFIAYELTSNAGGGDNLHRNIIYRENKDKADQVLPYTTFESENPEDLWKWMTEWEKTTGGKILDPAQWQSLERRMFALTTRAARRDPCRGGNPRN